MALQVYWYDFVCFGIVGVSWCCALWVIWKKEGSSERLIPQDSTLYESLVVARSEDTAVSVGHLGKRQLWDSCWRGVHPKWLLFTRSLSFLVLSACLAWDILEWDTSIFVYYTEWTFALVILYFAVGIVLSAHGCWVYSNSSHHRTSEDREASDIMSSTRDLEENRRAKAVGNESKLESRERAGLWGYLMQTTFQTCAGAVILTDVVFWCVIVPFISNSHLGLNLLMGCMHTLNAVFVLLDTALNSLPFPWFRLAYFVLWSCLYVIFQWVIHACGFSWWPYPFLELDSPWAPLWYFCLALIHIPCYGIYALIVKAKYKILPALFPHAFVKPSLL